MDNLPFTTEQWLHWIVTERSISLKVAQERGLQVTNAGVRIPITDSHGTFLFNKYRRAPWKNDGPKYLYDKGATAQLYGADFLGEDRQVILCEGELDSLALASRGYTAVSSTGGANTFLPAWKDLLKNRDVIILFDSDTAGARGAVRILDALGFARVAFMPYGTGKDVSEALARGFHEEIYTAVREAVLLTNDWRATLETLKRERVSFIQERRKSPIILDMYIDHIYTYIEYNKTETRKVKRNDDAVTIANSYPIKKLLKVNRSGFARCIFGCRDSDASMKVYNDNHAYSFCCGKRADAISVYRTLHPEKSFIQTLNDLS